MEATGDLGESSFNEAVRIEYKLKRRKSEKRRD